MTHAVFANSLHQYIPDIRQITRNIIKISYVALPIIASCHATVTEAGPIAAAACFAACEAFLATISPASAVAYAPTCFEGCKIDLAAPMP